jgi:hypothetical protein
VQQKAGKEVRLTPPGRRHRGKTSFPCASQRPVSAQY